MASFLPHNVEKAVLRYYEGLGTPTALKCYMLFKAGEWDQLSTLEVDPRNYLTANAYWRDASSVNLLRKLKELPTSVDREAKAVETFYQCEASCFRTNERLSPLLWGSLLPENDCGVLSFVGKVRKMIASILGPAPTLIEGRFGPGATYADKGRLATVPDKMTSSPTLTRDAWPFLFQWGGTLWASACASSRRGPLFVKGNRFSTVPKDSTKFRSIAVEPSVNVFFQLGLGRVIRKRLSAVGVDLLNGQDIHRRKACEASSQGYLATIDLSNASDTISYNLVKLLLPARWFELLEMARSPMTQVKGKWVRLEKFSSMGNGFTFELETLLFGCLTAVASGGVLGVDVFAYGDDLIFPASRSEDVISVLRYFGMEVNRRKSFVDSPFRESCGGDFFDGKPVRTYYLKEVPDDTRKLISFANGIRAGCHGNAFVFHDLLPAWLCILDGIPTKIRRLRGPQAYGDICIHDDEERWQVYCRDGIRWLRVWVASPAKRSFVEWSNFKPDVVLASACYGVGDGRRGITPRSPSLTYSFGRVSVS